MKLAEFNIVLLAETKLDYFDDINILNYTVVKNSRKIRKKAFGGVAILIRNDIAIM